MPEPTGFDSNVRIPGQLWLKAKIAELGIAAQDPVPSHVWKNYDYWTRIIDHAHEVYGGCCAYLACYIELGSGAVTIDHFKNKNQHPNLAYEWSNYRLASHGRNRVKNAAILDPFAIEDGWFHLELATGSIFPNPDLDLDIKSEVAHTIKHLRLDDKRCRSDRMKYYDDFRRGDISSNFLQRMNPFVYAEAARQGLL